jgi:hypothetical protein
LNDGLKESVMLKRSTDIEAVAVLFVICVFGTFVCGVHFGWTQEVFCGSAFAFAIAGWVSVVMYSAEVNWLIRSGNVTFEQIRWKFLAQSVVDKRLAEFAATFDELCKKEVRLQRSVDDSDDQELSDLRVMLEVAKMSFWQGHTLARRLGFEVRPKVSDYLTTSS